MLFDALPIKTGDFAMTELRKAMISTQGNKATGLDGIPAEVWNLECVDCLPATMDDRAGWREKAIWWRESFKKLTKLR